MNAKARVLVVIVVLLLAMILQTQPAATQEETLPLSERGPYGVGVQTVTFVDDSRNGRRFVTEVWYPAIIPEGEYEDLARSGLPDAEADTTGAPYPLILYSPFFNGSPQDFPLLLSHLASQGFVVAAVDHQCDWMVTCLIDRPIDVLFVLDQLASITEGELAGMIDGEQVGVTGYSAGSITTMMLTGAQLDPAYYTEWCANRPQSPNVSDICYSYRKWDKLVAYRAGLNPPLDADPDALWPAFTDDRIRAVLPIAMCGGPLFGERGSAAATVRTLIVAATEDQVCPYEEDAVFLYEHLGSESRYLLSFVGADQNFGGFWGPSVGQTFLKQIATAFFGYCLQGKEEYAQYLTAEYVEQFENLAWEVYDE